jgi:hypothetical protein
VEDVRYRIIAAEREGHWVARAEWKDTGTPFGIECAAATERAAIAKLAGWIDWQQEHEAALAALQDAERSYHRSIVGSAFANPTEGPTPLEIQKEALRVVEAARVRLDQIRAERPE